MKNQTDNSVMNTETNSSPKLYTYHRFRGNGKYNDIPVFSLLANDEKEATAMINTYIKSNVAFAFNDITDIDSYFGSPKNYMIKSSSIGEIVILDDGFKTDIWKTDDKYKRDYSYEWKIKPNENSD